MSNPKEVAKKLLVSAQERNVRFPKIWNDMQLVQECGAILMANRSDGVFDVEAALEALVTKHGVEASQTTESSSSSDISNKKRKTDTDNTDEHDEAAEQMKKKKEKKELVVLVEANRPIADVILEMGSIYFKNGDARKGGVFSKAAKAIREAETEITNQKDAMKLKGIGKGIAAYVEEFLETKMITRLEEMRAGTA